MQAEMLQMLKRLLLSPSSEMEFLVSAALGAAVFVLVLNKVGTAMDLKVAQTGRSLAVLAILLAVGLVLLVLMNRQFRLPLWAEVAAGVGVVLIVGAPVASFLQKGNCLSAFFALLLSIAAALVMVTVTHTAFGAFGKGEQSVGRGLNHNRETEQFLQQ